jgi:hypothetical protein
VIHESALRYRGSRYLWAALALTLACAVIYSTQRGLRPAGGGTWQGYVVGTIGALLIVWLTCLGIRKRRYASSVGSVAGWTSAHIYLGLALIPIATLHCAAKFGWNVHTLAYVLMCVVIVSGITGIYGYLSFPSLLSTNRSGGPRSQLFAELYALDNEGREVAGRCVAAINTAVKSSIERTAIGGGVFSQLFGRDQSLFILEEAAAGAKESGITGNRDQQRVIDYVSNRVPRADKRVEASNLQTLVLILCRRQAVLRRIRLDVRLHAWLKIWLYVHVPLSIALLVSLIVHIVTTFIYW